MIHKHRKHFHVKSTSALGIVGLLMGIGLAAIDTVWALYLESFGLSASQVGITSGFLIAVSVCSVFLSTYVLERLDEKVLVVLSLLAQTLLYALIAVFSNFYVFLALAACVTVFGVFRSNAFDIIFRDNTNDDELSAAQGMLYSLYNVAWFVGPLAAGFFMATFGLRSVFAMTSFFLGTSLVFVVLIHLNDIQKKHSAKKHNPFSNASLFLKKRTLRLPYVLCSGLHFWWSLIYIYVPLYIIQKGAGTEVVSLFIGVLAVPLIFVEYVVGKVVDKKGFKLFFILGYAGLALSAFASFFIPNIYVVLAILVISGLFSGMIEPIQDAFFFKKVSQLDEERFYPFFTTSSDVGAFLGRMSVAGFLLLLPLQFAFVITGIAMLLFALLSFKVDM